MRIVVPVLCATMSLSAWAGWCDCGAGIIRHDRSAEAYRKLGEAGQFQCVGEVVRLRRPDEPWKPSGSAVLVAPRWALTAAHVAVSDLASQRYKFGGQEYRAVRCVIRPVQVVPEPGQDASLAGIAAGADLALVLLDRAVTHVKPAERYRGNSELGRTMTKVGYGVVGDGLAGMKLPPTQERRGGQNVIDSLGGTVGKLALSKRVLVCDFDSPTNPAANQLGEPTPVELEIGHSVGDSGGGWFIQDSGLWKLVAVHSGSLPNKEGKSGRDIEEKYGSIMAGMRVSTANQWIDDVLRSLEPGDGANRNTPHAGPSDQKEQLNGARRARYLAMPSARSARPLTRSSRSRNIRSCRRRRPGGTFDDSPAINRWVGKEIRARSPVGTIEPPHDASVVPTGLSGMTRFRSPALTCWATVNRPSGT